MGEFNALAHGGVNDRVIAHDVTSTNGVDSDFGLGPFSNNAESSMTRIVLVAQVAYFGEDFGEAFGRSARGIFFIR